MVVIARGSLPGFEDLAEKVWKMKIDILVCSPKYIERSLLSFPSEKEAFARRSSHSYFQEYWL